MNIRETVDCQPLLNTSANAVAEREQATRPNACGPQSSSARHCHVSKPCMAAYTGRAGAPCSVPRPGPSLCALLPAHAECVEFRAPFLAQLVGAVAGSLAAGSAAGGVTVLGESAAGELGGTAGADSAPVAGVEGEAAADAGASRGVSGGGQSFTADTNVQLTDGKTKAISKLRPGDKVKSTDTKTGRNHSSTTSAVMVNHDTDLYDLKIHTARGDRTIHTTAHHRFFDLTRHSWVEAAKLPKGDKLTRPTAAPPRCAAAPPRRLQRRHVGHHRPWRSR